MADASAQVHPNPFHVELYGELKQWYEGIHPSYRKSVAVVCVLIVLTAFFRITVGSPRTFIFGEDIEEDLKSYRRGSLKMLKCDVFISRKLSRANKEENSDNKQVQDPSMILEAHLFSTRLSYPSSYFLLLSIGFF